MSPREIAARIGSPAPVSPQQRQKPDTARPSDSSGFADKLKEAQRQQDPAPADVKLSAHAEQRIQQRNISLDATQRQSLNEALSKLDQKGSRDALLLRSDAAFLVNVPNRTVVTAMPQDELQDRVFTQIDSAMLL
jgi:flagellar operon protein